MAINKRIIAAEKANFRRRPWSIFLEWLPGFFKHKNPLKQLVSLKPGDGVVFVSCDGTSIVFLDIKAGVVKHVISNLTGSDDYGGNEFVMHWFKSEDPWSRDRFTRAMKASGVSYQNLDDFAEILFGVAEPQMVESQQTA